jgi:Abnormal spindle-like microcephaly-assoc'd, ASPM-SPD-2-Hydin
VYLTGLGDFNQPFFWVNMSQAFSNAFISKISAQNAPALGYGPLSLTFGTLAIGMTSQPQTLNLANLGSATLHLNSIVVGGGGFAQSSGTTCGTTLGAWAQCTYPVTFTPQSTSPATGMVTITDNSSGSPHVIPLLGEGAVAALVLNPTSLSFPSTAVGHSSQAETITLTNDVNQAIAVSHIAVSGDFAETNNCGSTVPAGQKCTISVTFIPTAVGVRNGTLTITDNASNSPQTVPVSGTGGTGTLNLQLAQGQSSSATVQAGQTATYHLSLGAGGVSGMATLSCSGAPSGATCSVPASMNVPAGTATPFTVSVTTASGMMAMLHSAWPLRWFGAAIFLCLLISPGGAAAGDGRGAMLGPASRCYSSPCSAPVVAALITTAVLRQGATS